MQLHDQRTAPTLASVIDGFAQWRASGTSKYRTPKRLQEQAVGLLAQHPKSHICKSLNIPYSALKQWALNAQNNEAMAGHQSDAAGPSVDNTRFVQMPASPDAKPESTADDQSHLTQLGITLPNGAVLSTALPIRTLFALINQAHDSQGVLVNTEQKG